MASMATTIEWETVLKHALQDWANRLKTLVKAESASEVTTLEMLWSQPTQNVHLAQTLVNAAVLSEAN